MGETPPQVGESSHAGAEKSPQTSLLESCIPPRREPKDSKTVPKSSSRIRPELARPQENVHVSPQVDQLGTGEFAANSPGGEQHDSEHAFWKSEVSALSPSSDEGSRDDKWCKASRPIKRKVQSVEQRHVSSLQQPGCSHWETPECFRSLDECSPAKRSNVDSDGDRVIDSDAELISGSGVTIHALPLPSDWDSSPERGERLESNEEGEFAIEKTAQLSPQGDPKWAMLLDMKQQLLSMMQSYRPAVGSATGRQSLVVDPLSHRRPVVSGTDVISHRRSPSFTAQRQDEVDLSRESSVSQQLLKEHTADRQSKHDFVRQMAERTAKRQDGSRREAQAKPEQQRDEAQKLINEGSERQRQHQAGAKHHRDDPRQSSHEWAEREREHRVIVARQDAAERQREHRMSAVRQDAVERESGTPGRGGAAAPAGFILL
ncbi:uncharacterized protein [Palaemon carinicauda]|uniref:uncharacterized protein n=1 Tax=Palaemon carinicauda TaxID=392227 RepID=UPI0035B5C61E